jgi:thiamine-phosphate pyrophosphorylase
VRRRLALPALYAIVDPLDTGRDPVELATAMLAGGARALQLRLKDATSRTLLDAARAIAPRARAADAVFIVDDRLDVALAAGADGVHLGQDDLPLAAARRVAGDALWIGVSTHDPGQAQEAAAAGADYLGLGPMYTTTSKRKPLAPRGPGLVAAVRPLVDVPLVAIGGITLDTAPAVRAAGADAVAMIGALVRAPDVEQAVRDTVARLG